MAIKIPFFVRISVGLGAAILLLSYVVTRRTSALTAPIIPRELLFSTAERARPLLSPDGKYLAYLASSPDGVLNIWLRTVGGHDDRQVTHEQKRSIRSYSWSSDGTLLLYIQDMNGDENWHLYGLDWNEGVIKDYTPFDKVQARVLAQSHDVPDEMLIELNKDNPSLHDVYRLNMKAGTLELTERNPGNVIGWHADTNLRLRAKLTMRSDGGRDLLMRESDAMTWKPFISWTADEAMASGPICFTRDGHYAYLLDARAANTASLMRLDLRTYQTDRIGHDNRYDITRVVLDPQTRYVRGYYVTGKYTKLIITDTALNDDIEYIKKIDTGEFYLASGDYNDTRWIVGFEKDDGPGSYYLYDRVQKSHEHLFDNKPELKRYRLAPMEPIEFTARDGLKLEGYCTFPVGVVRRNLPLVLVVHGGPWSRDSWGYDTEAQWLANRGYACLQINFRGSTGYGKSFVAAGDKEWGNKMLNDIIDAANWAIEQKIADPQKIAIYGASYGGYAALCGATMADCFSCAVDIVGFSSLLTFLESLPPYWIPQKELFNQKVGDALTEQEILRTQSPLFFIDAIKIPVLIAHGAHDPRVKQAESEQIVSAMKAKNISHEYILFDDEGHGFVRQKNRLYFYARAEEFLARNLGGRLQPFPSV